MPEAMNEQCVALNASPTLPPLETVPVAALSVIPSSASVLMRILRLHAATDD